MKKQMLLFAALAVGACGTSEEEQSPDAIDDFIQVSELDAVTAIRSYDEFGRTWLNDHYVILTTNREQYLVAHYGRCMELPTEPVTPDVRRDKNAIYAKTDTFHGCRIKAIYPISEAQIRELLEMGRAPGER